MAEYKRKLKSKKREPDRATLYVAITLFVIAGIVLLLAVLSVGMHGGTDYGTGDDGTGTHTGTFESSDTDVITSDDTEADITPPVNDTGDIGMDKTTTTDPDETSSEASGGAVLTVGTEKVNADSGNAEIVMIYPTVEYAASSYDTGTMNEIIREYMNDQRRLMCMGTSGEEYEYIIEKTEIKYVGKTFFSALVTGHFYISDEPSPTVFAYAVNFDTTTCTLLRDNKMIFDFERIRDYFVGGRFELKEGMNGLLSETNYEDMIMAYRPEYGIYPEVYFTDDGFGIAVELVYTLGGYALFEIPRASLGNAVYDPTQ